MTLLSAHGVSHSYRSHRWWGPAVEYLALKDVSLDLAAGETLALLGRSGCGKSTLARILCGLERPSEGVVSFEGRPLDMLETGAQRRMRAAVQLVFQDSIEATNPRFTVERIIGEPLRHLTALDSMARRNKIETLLTQVELPLDMMHRRPAQLSGGQLQRVCIARALAPGPRVLILDEAVSNLDVPLQISTLALLERIRRETGIACLFVTHDLRLVERLAARVVIMEAGRIVEEASSARLANLSHCASRELREAILPARPIGRPRRQETSLIGPSECARADSGSSAGP